MTRNIKCTVESRVSSSPCRDPGAVVQSRSFGRAGRRRRPVPQGRHLPSPPESSISTILSPHRTRSAHKNDGTLLAVASFCTRLHSGSLSHARSLTIRAFNVYPPSDRGGDGLPSGRSTAHHAARDGTTHCPRPIAWHGGEPAPRKRSNEPTVDRSQPRIRENEPTAGRSQPRIRENEPTAGRFLPRIRENEPTIIGVAVRL